MHCWKSGGRMGAGEQMNKIQFDYFQGMEAEQL